MISRPFSILKNILQRMIQCKPSFLLLIFHLHVGNLYKIIFFYCYTMIANTQNITIILGWVALNSMFKLLGEFNCGKIEIQKYH